MDEVRITSNGHTSQVDHRREWMFVGFCCLVAAIRIFAFSAAFPFFDNSDEATHFDTISRYAHGEIPSELSMYSPQAARMVAQYNSPEYFDLPSVNVMPPADTMTPEEANRTLDRSTLAWRRRVSHESTSPPVYYALAGAWYDVGKSLGFDGLRLLYWTRFLNIPIYVLLLLAAFLLTKALFPQSQFLTLGVQLILAFLPQDIFYSLNDDPLAALLATFALYLIFRFDRAQSPSVALMAGAGLMTAGAFLTKYSTAPVLAMLFMVIWRKQWPKLAIRQSISRAAWLPLLCTSLPIFTWFAHNCALSGDPTGMAARNRFLGWTPKPFSQWWHHPIFTIQGFSVFFAELMKTFWRGEFCWHRLTIASPVVDTIYVATSAIFLICFFIRLFLKPRPNFTPAEFAIPFCILMFALSIAFLIYLSISIDFGQCPYPSRDWPYFTSGRLILAALVPFLIIYLSGLDALLGWLRLRFAWPYLLASLAALMTISELLLSRGVFASQYNWFHLH